MPEDALIGAWSKSAHRLWVKRLRRTSSLQELLQVLLFTSIFFLLFFRGKEIEAMGLSSCIFCINSKQVFLSNYKIIIL